MRAPRTLVSYIVREVLLYTALGLASITVVLVTRNLVRALDELAAVGFALDDVLTVIRLLSSMLVIYALPVSFLFGTLLAIGRMTADVEIIAMRACGIGLRAIALPIVFVGLLLSSLTLYLSLDVEPAARRAMREAVKQMLARGAAIEPGRFRRVGDRLLYAESRDRDQRLHGVVISDRSDPERPFIVFARTGSLRLDEEQGVILLSLESGDIHVESAPGDDERHQRIVFSHFEYAIDIEPLLGKLKKPRAKEMSLNELAATAARVAAGDTDDLREDPITYALHWHRRFVNPLAPTVFALIGVPLAMRRTRGARSLGVLWCAGIAFAYYALESFAEFLCIEGWLAPWASPWIPIVIFLGIGVLLLARMRHAGN